MTLRHVLSDFLDDQFGINARAAHTFKALFFHPGVLTEDYFAGRVERYNAPFRLYLLASVFFFVLAGAAFRQASPDISRQINAAHDSAAAHLSNDDAERVVFTIGASRDSGFFGIRVRRFPTNNWLRDSEVNFGNPTITRAAQKRMQELSLLGEAEGTTRLVASVLDQVPKVLFVLLPLYALLVYAFYWRKRRYYVEHFVFLLHLHAFAFLIMTLLLLPFEWTDGLVFLAILTYAIVAQRRFYKQSYPVVVLKTFVLSILYVSVLAIGVLASLALALLIA